MKIKKPLSIFLAVIMISMMFTSFPFTVNAAVVNTAATGEGTVISVGSAEALSAACEEINTNGGEYTLSLTGDITGGHISVSNSSAVVTVVGNSHTITTDRQSAVHVEGGAVVTLGDGTSGLTLSGNSILYNYTANDEPGLVYVMPGSICNMSADVTLENRKGNNYFGGGVTVQGGTFVMNGGTIQNCGIEGGSVCYGGGVTVFANGIFTMKGGTITGCYARSDYADEMDSSHYVALGGGVFVTDGSTFTMTGGTINGNEAGNMGGGIAVVISKAERTGSSYYPKSKVAITGGSVTGNTAKCGAGIYAAGQFYAHADAFGTASAGANMPSDPGLYTNGGSISGNTASDSGGGIYVTGLRPAFSVQIKNTAINNNQAVKGAGLCSAAYWTQAEIDGCTISGNTASSNGGGVYLSNNSDGGKTTIKNTAVTSNTSGARGAGVYYDANSPLYISGADVIRNNKYNGVLNNLNVYSLAKPVYVDGALTGSTIGLSDPTLWDDNKTDEDVSAVSTEYLTSGYKKNNPEVHPSEYFTSDHETWEVDRSAKSTTTQDDPSSKRYREYTVKRYALTSEPYLYAGHYNQYVITKNQHPDFKNAVISTYSDIVKEMKYRFSDTEKYTVTQDYSNESYGSTYIKYAPVDTDSPLSTITLQGTTSQGNLRITYSPNRSKRSSLGSVVYTVYTNDQYNYANSGELVLKITNNSDTSLIDKPELYNFIFSEDYTETTVNYVNANPPKDVLFEYDENGDVTAKLELVSYETKRAQITVETGTEDEVRLVRVLPNYHINNADMADIYTDDIFTSYVEAVTKEVKIGETIESFYKIPELKDNCGYIFKGWYYDENNDNDSRPVRFGVDKYEPAKDIYAHWIKVENVTKDDEDTNILPGDDNEYGGYELSGIQIRGRILDSNYGYRLTPEGMRFITVLSTDVVDQINAIHDNNIEYGYVAATNEDWINYHLKENPNPDIKLLYESINSNGIDTSETADDENYFGFASNIDCTSKIANPKKGFVKQDHRNYEDYLLYTLVITYEDDDGTGYDKQVLARPYIKYTDANNLTRIAYGRYRGTNILGGCKVSYNRAAGH